MTSQEGPPWATAPQIDARPQRASLSSTASATPWAAASRGRGLLSPTLHSLRLAPTGLNYYPVPTGGSRERGTVVGVVHQECHAHRIAVVERSIAQLGPFVPCATTGVDARALARLVVGKFDRARLALRHR